MTIEKPEQQDFHANTHGPCDVIFHDIFNPSLMHDLQ